MRLVSLETRLVSLETVLTSLKTRLVSFESFLVSRECTASASAEIKTYHRLMLVIYSDQT